MDYYDGNTVTGLWNYAQHYTLNDNSYSTQFGPSTPGAINVVSGQTNGATAHGGTTSNIENGTMIGDAEPLFDQCSNSGTPLNPDGTPGGVTASMSGQNIGDLLNRKSLTWGWFQGGFTPSEIQNGRAICGTDASNHLGQHANIGNSFSADYSEHHEPFQYYADTSNPNHVSPTSVSQVGISDPANTPATQAINHQYDLSWFNAAVKNGNMPAVSYLKAPEYEDGHAGYSEPLDEQRFLVDEINTIERSKDWSSTAIIIAYDDSDGWYDHQIGPIIRQSAGSRPTRSTGPGKCGSVATSAGARTTAVASARAAAAGDLTVGEAELRRQHVHRPGVDPAVHRGELEPRRIGDGSADSVGGDLDNAFDFNPNGRTRPGDHSQRHDRRGREDHPVRRWRRRWRWRPARRREWRQRRQRRQRQPR